MMPEQQIPTPDKMSFEDFGQYMTKRTGKDFKSLKPELQDKVWQQYLRYFEKNNAVESTMQLGAEFLAPGGNVLIAENKEQEIYEHPLLTSVSLLSVLPVVGIGAKLGMEAAPYIARPIIKGGQVVASKLGFEVGSGLRNLNVFERKDYFDTVQRLRQLGLSESYIGQGGNELVMDFVRNKTGFRDTGELAEQLKKLRDFNLEAGLKPYSLEGVYNAPVGEEFLEKVEKTKGELFSVKGVPESKAEKTIRKVSDATRPMKTLQDRLFKEGYLLDRKTDFVLQRTLLESRGMNRINEVRDGVIVPFFKQMSDRGVTLEQMDDYLEATHAFQRNKYVREATKGKRSFGGMSEKDAEETLARLDREGVLTKLQEVAPSIYEINRMRRDVLVRSGLVSQLEVDKWLANLGDTYVPLRGQKGEIASKEMLDQIRTKGVEADKGQFVKKIRGRNTRPFSPTAYSMYLLEQAEIAALENEVGKAFLEMAESIPDSKLWKISKITKPKLTEEGELVFEKLGIQGDPKKLERAKSVVYNVARNGEDYQITIADPVLAKSFLGTEVASRNAFIKAGSAVNRFMSGMMTTYNPKFLFTNLIGDSQTAIINASKEVPENIKGERSFFKAFKEEFANRKGAIHGMLTNSAEWKPWIEDFNKSGGGFGWLDMQSVHDIQKQIQLNIEKGMKISDASTARVYLNNAKDGFERLGRTIENVNRIIYFRQLRELGIDSLEAARVAKDLTVNFNQKGEWGTILNSLWIFSNAGIQGTSKLFSVLPDNSVQKALGGMMGGAASLTLMNKMIDPEGYAGLSPGLKDNYMILMLGDTGHHYLKFRLPHGYRWFYGLSEATTDMMSGGQAGPGDVTKRMLTSGLNAFSPLGGMNSGVLAALVPSWIGPVYENATNRDWKDTPVHPNNPDVTVAQPEGNPLVKKSDVAFGDTSPIAKQFARMMSYLEIRDETGEGMLGMDKHPEEWSNLWEGYFGGPATLLSGLGRLVTGAATEQDIPVYSWVVGKELGRGVMKLFGKNYRMAKNILGASDYYEAQARAGKQTADPLVGIVEKYRPFVSQGMRGYVNQTMVQLKKINDALEVAKDDATKNKLEKARLKIMGDFNTKIEAVRGTWEGQEEE